MPTLMIPAGLASFFGGRGQQAPLPPGNTSNPPGDAPLQEGNYQFIMPEMMQGAGHAATDIPDVPPAYQDWGQYPVNLADLSGNTGGGVYSGSDTNVSGEQMLFFDPQTGMYFDIGTGFGG